MNIKITKNKSKHKYINQSMEMTRETTARHNSCYCSSGERLSNSVKKNKEEEKIYKDYIKNKEKFVNLNNFYGYCKIKNPNNKILCLKKEPILDNLCSERISSKKMKNSNSVKYSSKISEKLTETFGKKHEKSEKNVKKSPEKISENEEKSINLSDLSITDLHLKEGLSTNKHKNQLVRYNEFRNQMSKIEKIDDIKLRGRNNSCVNSKTNILNINDVGGNEKKEGRREKVNVKNSCENNKNKSIKYKNIGLIKNKYKKLSNTVIKNKNISCGDVYESNKSKENN